ncbi:YdcF family protein [Sporolactobacillus sp. THM7-7]|nr:YdcF family protein [Sporolactobacillus sp. THM7-7]
MRISELSPNKLTAKQITELLFDPIHDDRRSGDCIFVFGSRKAVQYRLPKAIELYNAGRSGKILLSGGIIWSGSQLPEAVLLKNKAVDSGIPAADLLIETLSRNTKENVLASSLVLDRYFGLHKIQRLLIVTTIYHMRRAYLTLKTYMPDWIEYSLCPAEDPSAQKENWFLTERNRQRGWIEAEKLIHYVREGALIDDPI